MKLTGKTLVVSALTLALLLSVSCQKQGSPGEVKNSPTPDPVKETPAESHQEDQGQKEKQGAEGTKVDTESFVAQLQAKLAKHWPHMKELWPKMDYEEHPLILVHVNDDLTAKQAWVLTTKEVRKLEEKELKGMEIPTPGGYNQEEFQGKPAIILALDDHEFSLPDALNQNYRLATHELVHFYHQEMSDENLEGSRAQEYPLVATPRVYRRMIYTHLIAAYENPQEAEKHLGKAKYWMDKWATEFPDEYRDIKATDIAEGTAKYIENLADFVGDGLDQQGKRQKAIENIQKQQLFESADSESYELGYVAALLLDEKQPDWKNNFYQEEKTLLEKLLEKVSPIQEEMDPAVEKEATSYVEELNEDAKENLKDVLAAYEDKSVPYLKIAIPPSAPSYSIQDHFRYKKTDIMTNYANLFKVGDTQVEIRMLNLMQEMRGDHIYLLIPLNMEYKVTEGKLSISTDKLKIQDLPVEKNDVDGRTVYTAQ